ncbi:MAG: hypothetical protein H0X66_15975 [Verrucomicrobia bacterium]|nr:hypothetical protein [Verrucomicrobiota bacterium]
MSAAPKIITPLLVALLLVGCQTMRTVTPREAFFQKHPDLRARYHEFYETSPEAIAEDHAWKFSLGLTLIRQIREHHAECTDLMQSLDIVEKRFETYLDEGLSILQELKQVFNPKFDSLFWYSYGSGDNQGQGYVIVRNGNVYRTFWVAGSVKKPDEIP